MPATVAAAVAGAETVACHCCQQLKMRLLQAAVVSAVAAVGDADTVGAAAVPQAAGQQSVVAHCRVVEQQQDDVVAAVGISLLSFLQRLMNEVQSV